MIYIRDVKFISKAIKIAEENRNVKQYTICAMLANKRRILSIGFNSNEKTHPSTPQIYNWYTIPLHAEIDAISKFIKNNQIDNTMTLYVVGLTIAGNRMVCSSMPCDSCMEYITKHNIKRIVYTENDGDGFKIKELKR